MWGLQQGLRTHAGCYLVFASTSVSIPDACCCSFKTVTLNLLLVLIPLLMKQQQVMHSHHVFERHLDILTNLSIIFQLKHVPEINLKKTID